MSTLASLISGLTRNVPVNGLAGCIIKIGNTKISLAEVNPRTNTVVLPSGETVKITCNNGFLSISTPFPLDIALESAYPLNGLHIATGGNIILSSMGPTFRPQEGLHLSGKNVTVKVPVKSYGIVRIDATESVLLNKWMVVPNLHINAPKIFTKAKICFNKLAMAGDVLRQSADSKFDMNHVLLSTNSPLDATDPAQKVFIDARAELVTRTSTETVEKVAKTFWEKTWLEVIKGQAGPVIKETIHWQESRSVMNFKEVVLKGGINGKKLDINAKKKLIVKSALIVDDLRLKTSYLYGSMKALIDGKRKLEINGGGIAVVLCAVTADKIKIHMNHTVALFTGYICGAEDLLFEGLTCTAAFFGRIWGMNVRPYCGWFYLNMFGWVAAHNFVLDTFIPADFGFHTPYIPTTWKEFAQVSNEVKFLVAAKAVASFLFKPLGICIRAILKLGSVVRNLIKIKDIIVEAWKAYKAGPEAWQNYRNEKAPTNFWLFLIAIKDIMFAGNAMYDVKTAYDTRHSTPLNIPRDLAEAKTALENNWREVLIRCTPSFTPAYVIDSWRGIRAGYTITGGEVLTNTDMHDTYNRTFNLGA